LRKVIVTRLILFLFTLIAFLTSAIFAWMTLTEKTDNIIFTTGNLKVEANLYLVHDLNFDGINLDYDDTTEIIEPIIFERVTPGQIYTFKLVMKNEGTINGNLKVNLNLDTNVTNSNLKDLFLIEYEEPNNISTNLKDKMLLFDEILLEKNNTYTFIFKIIITEDVGNDFKNEIVKIDNLEITLDQIQI